MAKFTYLLTYLPTYLYVNLFFFDVVVCLDVIEFIINWLIDTFKVLSANVIVLFDSLINLINQFFSEKRF